MGLRPEGLSQECQSRRRKERTHRRGGPVRPSALGRRSGRFPPFPYPPPRSRVVVANRNRNEVTKKYTAARFSFKDGIVKHCPTGVNAAVQLKTILNSLERHKSFVYQEARCTGSETRPKFGSSRGPTVGPFARAAANRLPVTIGCRPVGRICPTVADHGVLRLCHAAGRLPAVRRNGGACPLERCQDAGEDAPVCR